MDGGLGREEQEVGAQGGTCNRGVMHLQRHGLSITYMLGVNIRDTLCLKLWGSGLAAAGGRSRRRRWLLSMGECWSKSNRSMSSSWKSRSSATRACRRCGNNLSWSRPWLRGTVSGGRWGQSL